MQNAKKTIRIQGASPAASDTCCSTSRTSLPTLTASHRAVAYLVGSGYPLSVIR